MVELFRGMGREARRIIASPSSGRPVSVNRFGDRVLAADARINRAVMKALSRIDCSVVSEESDGRASGATLFFVTDPLDGSVNYLRGFPAYSFAVCGGSRGMRFSRLEAAYALDLVTGDEYHAMRGKGAFMNGRRLRARHDAPIALICAEFGDGHPREAGAACPLLARIGYLRMLGACVNELCAVARGAASAYVAPFREIRSVHAPACMIAKEAGATVTDARGRTLDFPISRDSCFSIIAAEPGLHARIAAGLRGLTCAESPAGTAARGKRPRR